MHMRKLYLLQAHALALVAANPYHTRSNSSIEWSDCSEELVPPGGPPTVCGNVSVPLDYTNTTSEEKLQLSLVKVKASREPVKGTILINPGGPGISGSVELASPLMSQVLLNMTGGHHNLIGYDYRGVGQTLPVDCYNLTDPLQLFERFRYEAMAAPMTNQSLAAGETWTLQKMYADRCNESAGKNAELVSTAFTARDMMQIVDALGEDGMLRYWGHSYGTVLGSTLAAMFPDRIERMVIDGVANLHEYAEGWEFESIPAGDLALEQFLEACVRAGKDKCALAGEGVTAQNLTTRIHDLLKTVEREPIAMGNNITSELVGRGQVTEALDSGLRASIQFAPYIAQWFNAVFERNLTAYHQARAVLFSAHETGGPVPVGLVADATLAIRCTDAKFRTNELDDVLPRIEKLHSQSTMFGDSYAATYMACSQWKAKAKERYEGDFKAKTKHPMLIIGSPYDLRTPLVSARNASAGFEGSVVLQHNGYGHTVAYSPGQCAIKAVQDYFNTGKLPEVGTVCEQDYDVFSGKTIFDSFGVEVPGAA